MKKLILFSVIAVMGISFSSCKKEENNTGTTQETCLLKSSKSIVSTQGSPNEYQGFVVYRNTSGIINRLNFLNSTTGNEETTSYVSLSFNGNNISDIKLFDKGNNYLTFDFTYNADNRVAQRSFNSITDLGPSYTEQKYFYDNNGRISYSVRTTTIDSAPNIGKVISKDSALYQNYNSFNRPSGIVVYNSVTTPFGTDPYKFNSEFAYEYDAKGNRTKTSYKAEDMSSPFEVIHTATFNLEKDFGIAQEAYKILSKLFVEGWDSPNFSDDDYDKNLQTSETETEDGKTTTTTSTYTFNDKGYPSESTDVSGNIKITSTLTYECK